MSSGAGCPSPPPAAQIWTIESWLSIDWAQQRKIAGVWCLGLGFTWSGRGQLPKVRQAVAVVADRDGGRRPVPGPRAPPSPDIDGGRASSCEAPRSPHPCLTAQPSGHTAQPKSALLLLSAMVGSPLVVSGALTLRFFGLHAQPPGGPAVVAFCSHDIASHIVARGEGCPRHRRLARHWRGDRPAVRARRSPGRLQLRTARNRKRGDWSQECGADHCHAVQADLTGTANAAALVQAAVERFGSARCAGGQPRYLVGGG